jgi:cytochrome o ubiquinol oxidase subunit 3
MSATELAIRTTAKLKPTKSAEQLHEERVADDKTIFGFWVYLMTDCLLFASLFATFAVLRNNTNGGEPGHELFSLPFVLTETMILLASSFTCGLAMLALRRQNKRQVIGWFVVTFLLGLAFLGMELFEFHNLVAEGNGWQRSGFLSSFFTLVGTHGLHITIGLMWIAVLLWQLSKRGFARSVVRRMALLSMFWHFLDVIWIFIFTFVYLMGEVQL